MKQRMGWGVGLAMIAMLVMAPARGSLVPDGFSELPKGEFKPAALGAREPRLEIDYPGGARKRGVTKGIAVVSILVGADGQPLDFFVSSATDPAFGTALLERARLLTFEPAMFKGTPVAARLNLSYEFEAGSSSLDVMEAARLRMTLNETPSIQPVQENKLDQPLTFTHVGLPRVPAAYAPPGDEPVKVFVTFYVDEEGRTHAPNVESAASPLLFSGAIKAVRQWTFQPPTVNGKPVTVFAGRSVGFIPRNPPATETPAAEAQKSE